MNSTVGRLEARGLVARKPHPTHRTLIEISLTDEGRELFRRADGGASELDALLSSVLAEEERDVLVSLLSRVTGQARAVSERRSGTVQPG
jgi:DNA-binding MarR family transcriptional regulator